MAGIALDRSRPFGEVHGDTGTLNIAYEQNVGGVLLPFDAHGRLIETALDPAQREVVKKRRANKPDPRPAGDEADGPPVADVSPAADVPTDGNAQGANLASEVNLTLWLSGEAKYPWHIIQGEMRTRYGKNVKNAAEAAEFLVMDQKIMNWDEVVEQYRPKREAA